MYNFNTSLQTPPMLGVGMDFGSTTPRTPEILNSLIAMTNPFEYSYASVTSSQSLTIPSSDASPVIACKTESFLNQQYDNNSQSNCSSSSSLESPSSTPLHMAATISTTPSLQQTRSQLIKAGVKLLIQSKRKNSGSSSCDADYRPPPAKIRATSVLSPSPVPRKNSIQCEVPSCLTSPKDESSPFDGCMIKTDDTSSCDEDSETKFSTGKHQLTPEDEDRRRRRRERNKIAATKCRLKKRECINNLMRESETLENQNVDLKSQLKDLREQYNYLTEMWQAHQAECKNPGLVGNGHETNNNNQNNNNSIGNHFNEQETLKDTNNNKHLQDQLPSLTPLINCNLSFDFY